MSEYKLLNNVIACVRTGDVTLLSPSYLGIAEDESIPWVETDRKIIRLPDFSFVFDDDPKYLDALKVEKINTLHTLFNKRVSGSFITSQGYLMQFDTSDSIKMQGAITLMEAVGSTTGYITQANDETVYNVSIETMKQVLIEMLNAYAKCHARKQELRKIINSAQSKEELDEIEISWPV